MGAEAGLATVFLFSASPRQFAPFPTPLRCQRNRRTDLIWQALSGVTTRATDPPRSNITSQRTSRRRTTGTHLHHPSNETNTTTTHPPTKVPGEQSTPHPPPTSSNSRDPRGPPVGKVRQHRYVASQPKGQHVVPTRTMILSRRYLQQPTCARQSER